MNVSKCISLLLLLFIFQVSFINAQEQEADWTQLKILQSTRADVEKVLGAPYEKANNDFFGSYRVKGGNLFIDYSLGFCRPIDRRGWNVAEQTVVEMGFFYYESPTIESLKLDKRKFKKVVEGDVLDIFTYKNDEEGIKYIVQDGLVETIVYYPKKNFNRLYCGVINHLKTND